MMSKLHAFGAFWYDFIIGDDWTIALGVLVALAVTYGITAVTSLPAWWILPIAMLVVLALRLWRATHHHRPRRAAVPNR
jgi:hypothetical protein